MKCYTCQKQLEKDDLKCGLEVKRKDNGRYETHLECGKCHVKKWSAQHLEDLKAIANECKTEAQLTAAFQECSYVQRWKKDNPALKLEALKIYNARVQCF